MPSNVIVIKYKHVVRQNEKIAIFISKRKTVLQIKSVSFKCSAYATKVDRG